MKSRATQRFDSDALRSLAGGTVFARGEAYARGGHVEIVRMEPARVVARVSGTELYRTVVSGQGKRIGGECSCPAFEDRGFCKHMVAVALAVNAAPEGGAKATGAPDRIRRHLTDKGLDALVDVIIDLAERDSALFRKLDLAAAARYADERTLETSLRKAIDAAAGTGGYVEYREVGGWADGVSEVLDAIAALAANGRGGLALKLADHAFEKIEAAIQNIDDSNGDGGGLLNQVAAIHLSACQAVRPDPVKLATELFAREMRDDYDCFDGAAETYADVLGAAGLADYRRRASEAWDKLPARAPGRGKRQEISGDYHRLARILDFFAERDGDVNLRIALRAKDLSSAWNYLQLAEFCLAHGRRQEALSRAEEGLWMFEDEEPDARLVDFTAELLVKSERATDAVALLWRSFEKFPSLELLSKLKRLDGAGAVARAIECLEKRLVRERPSQWHFPSTLLIEVLMVEKMFDRAWVTARRHGASPQITEALAKASEKSHPAEALEIYMKLVVELANSGSGYEEAARLIARMAPLRGAAEQRAYVAGLKDVYRRRRNFMKLLE